jgi:hypothetical protein
MIYQEVSGSDFRDQSIVNGVRSSTTFLETTSEVHSGRSQSMSDWLQIDQHRESEFAHDSDAEPFHNWRHDEGWMQCRSLFVSASSEPEKSSQVSYVTLRYLSEMSRSIPDSIATGSLNGFFLIAAQNDHMSRRVSHALFRFIGHETVNVQDHL